MSLLLLITGIVVLALTIVAPIIAAVTTPTNLRGFYSAKYIPIALIGAAAGITMIVISFFVR